MEKIPTLPLESESEVYVYSEFDPSSLESIETWYRSIRPDADMRTIPRDVHVDAIASAVLHLNNAEVPVFKDERLTAALGYSTNIVKATERMALHGSSSLLVSDMILELVERGNVPPVLRNPLLDFSQGVALNVRENPLVSKEDQLKANGKYADSAIAKLKLSAKEPGADVSFSDEYIKIVQSEASWASKHTRGAKSGVLFEAYVGVLAKYKLWATENDERLYARHATLREDAPIPKRLGGSGHNTSHDVTMRAPFGKILVQCKLGGLANEQEDRYDREKVMQIAETSDDGTLLSWREFQTAFEAIASGDMDIADKSASRYRIDQAVEVLVGFAPRAVGQKALLGTTV